MEQTIEHSYFELEYSQISDNIRFLADVRFNQLALIPVLGGVGIVVLARYGLSHRRTDLNQFFDCV